jgi:hypothetical protein
MSAGRQQVTQNFDFGDGDYADILQALGKHYRKEHAHLPASAKPAKILTVGHMRDLLVTITDYTRLLAACLPYIEHCMIDDDAMQELARHIRHDPAYFAAV